MFNKVIICGNLTRDVELKYLPNGNAIATSGIASTRKFKKTDGNYGEEVCFVDLTFFGRTAEVANQYLSRGKKVLIEGRLKLDQWTDNQGQKRSKHLVICEELVMLDNKRDNSNELYEENNESYKIPDVAINDDEIPF